MIDTILKRFGYPVVSLSSLLLGIPHIPKWRPRTYFAVACKSASQIPQYRQKKGALACSYLARYIGIESFHMTSRQPYWCPKL